MEVGRTPLRASSSHNNSEPGVSSPSPTGHMGTQVLILELWVVNVWGKRFKLPQLTRESSMGARIASYKIRLGTLERTLMIMKVVCAK